MVHRTFRMTFAGIALCVLMPACAQRVASPADAVREPWRDPGSMLCAQVAAGAEVLLQSLARSSNIGGLVEPTDPGERAPLGVANSVCGPQSEPCLCGPRDLLFWVLAAGTVGGQQEEKYMLFEWDAVEGTGDTSLFMSPGMFEVARLQEDTPEGCARVRIDLQEGRRLYAEVQTICPEAGSANFRFGAGEPPPED